jgi:uncharacterized protein YjbJ (UPF0337 family)
MKPGKVAVLAGMAAVMAVCASACERGEGAGQKTKGRIESAAGSITGDAQLKREGKKDEVVGGVKNTIGDLKGAVHDASK